MEEFDTLYEIFSTNTSFCLTWKCQGIQDAKTKKIQLRRHKRKVDAIIYISQFARKAAEGPIYPIKFDFRSEHFFNSPQIVNLFTPNQTSWTWLTLMQELFINIWTELPLIDPMLIEIQQKAFLFGILNEPSYLIEICDFEGSIFLRYNFDLDFYKSKPARFVPLIPTIRERARFAGSTRPEFLWDKDKFWNDHTERVRQVWDDLTPAERTAFEQNLTLS